MCQQRKHVGHRICIVPSPSYDFYPSRIHGRKLSQIRKDKEAKAINPDLETGTDCDSTAAGNTSDGLHSPEHQPRQHPPNTPCATASPRAGISRPWAPPEQHPSAPGRRVSRARGSGGFGSQNRPHSRQRPGSHPVLRAWGTHWHALLLTSIPLLTGASLLTGTHRWSPHTAALSAQPLRQMPLPGLSSAGLASPAARAGGCELRAVPAGNHPPAQRNPGRRTIPN